MTTNTLLSIIATIMVAACFAGIAVYYAIARRRVTGSGGGKVQRTRDWPPPPPPDRDGLIGVMLRSQKRSKRGADGSSQKDLATVILLGLGLDNGATVQEIVDLGRYYGFRFSPSRVGDYLRVLILHGSVHRRRESGAGRMFRYRFVEDEKKDGVQPLFVVHGKEETG